MTSALIVTGFGSVVLLVMAVLARQGKVPSAAALSGWLFAMAGCAASLELLYVVQIVFPGKPDIYTMLRLVMGAAMVGGMVRIVLLCR